MDIHEHHDTNCYDTNCQLHTPPRAMPVTFVTLGIFFLILIIIGVVAVFLLSLPPVNAGRGTIIHVEKNASLVSVAQQLVEKNVVQSKYLVRIAVDILGHSNGATIAAGDYLFVEPSNVWNVSSRLIHNEQGFDPVRVTLPEGSTVKDMARILTGVFNATSSSPSISNFNVKTFISLASTSEGYLFPDTYLFAPNATADVVFVKLASTHDDAVQSLSPDITAFQSSMTSSDTKHIYPRTMANIVNVASILEREATSTVDRRIIAGIIWKRLDMNMPLGIDPPFMYILGKTSSQLTVKDLATTSPYNLYTHTGLPPTPISNPGLDALTDAVHPTVTPYLYYLNDTKGFMHYAATYEGHLANQAKYIK